ncbi:radical SAM family heme chaperone HemW [Aquihabitans sp. G128]|uniref:radical SAM family heme chaperone HemW n=1 Tax=Aquihabitans sp. G128 TaxID=2849779 RepID=UPI001C243C23|nr:radical SAM family heme chaperone HemW [Aquihabitans sp. G128]QXC61555.1 radical SAM family heme chaperone HemW [Aquihabitans sp. G128]
MAFGLYLHVPFCRHRCDYCAFATWTDRHHLAEQYLAACRAQIVAAAPDLPPVTSVFVGGGTPTLVDPHALVDVLAAVPLAPGAEVSVECNPDDLTADMAATYAAGGVNRLSIGVQSMVPEVLATLGRDHDPANVRRAAEAAHAAGLAFNLDLVYGAAGETLAQWRRSLDEVVALDPTHVSAYALTVEAGTPLAADPARHPDDDTQADQYQLATDVLGAAGYEWYEISNWAKPGHECRHNLLYWTEGEYLAVGCAAHGHRDGRRSWNYRTPERYVAAIESGRSPEAGAEELEADDRRLEGLQLAIRTRDGIAAEEVAAEVLVELEGLVVRRDDRVVLTPHGRLLANEVAIRLT